MAQVLSEHLVQVDVEPLLVNLSNGQTIKSSKAFKLIILVENIELEISVNEVEMQ